MSMSGKMSVGIRRIVATPMMTMSIDITTNVYGRLSATRTIHMVHSHEPRHGERPIVVVAWSDTLRVSIAGGAPPPPVFRGRRRGPALRPRRAAARHRAAPAEPADPALRGGAGLRALRS